MMGAPWASLPFSMQHVLGLDLGFLTAGQPRDGLWSVSLVVHLPENKFQEDAAGITRS